MFYLLARNDFEVMESYLIFQNYLLFMFRRLALAVGSLFSRKPVTLIDIGGGKEGRAYRLAEKHLKKKFVLVDPDLDAIIQGKKLRNVRKKYEKGLEYLRTRRSNSAEIINLDFSGMSPEHDKKLVHAPNKLVFSKQFFDEAKRVLVKNGRLYITTHESDVQNVLKMLGENGFKVTGSDTIANLEKKGLVSTTSGEIEYYREKEVLHKAYRIAAKPIK